MDRLACHDVYQAFVKHPNYGQDDFMTKLKGQMAPASALAQQLMGEMLWALLLFPSNMKAPVLNTGAGASARAWLGASQWFQT